MFERVAEAYEFLVSWHRDDVVKDGPDPRRITLIIRAQSILYKYAAGTSVRLTAQKPKGRYLLRSQWRWLWLGCNSPPQTQRSKHFSS